MPQWSKIQTILTWKNFIYPITFKNSIYIISGSTSTTTELSAQVFCVRNHDDIWSLSNHDFRQHLINSGTMDLTFYIVIGI